MSQKLHSRKIGFYKLSHFYDICTKNSPQINVVCPRHILLVHFIANSLGHPVFFQVQGWQRELQVGRGGGSFSSSSSPSIDSF